MKPYTLRHYFISVCIMSHRNLFTIARWVGHKNTRMIEEVYGHLFDDYSAEEMAKVRVRSEIEDESPDGDGVFQAEQSPPVAPIPAAKSTPTDDRKPDLALVSGDE